MDDPATRDPDDVVWIYTSPRAERELDREDVQRALHRHFKADWGDCWPDERQANDEAVRAGGLVRSVYRDRHGTRFFIVTDIGPPIATEPKTTLGGRWAPQLCCG